MLYLGIDVGTSSVKVLLADTDGVRFKAQKPYVQSGRDGWQAAIREAVDELAQQADLTAVCGIGLSSQVGTYLVDDGTVIGWDSPAGDAELQEIKAAVTPARFVEQIAMDHPNIVSYPLPRLLHIRRRFPACRHVQMPKDWLVGALTGRPVTDVFSWRGLAHTVTGCYAKELMAQFDLSVSLPPLLSPTDQAGCVTSEASKAFHLPTGIPVFVGCNDFFAGLLGMGVMDCGTLFDLSGTSEHVGVVSPMRQEGALVSGPYFAHFVTYGGTKASGLSCRFAMRELGLEGVTLQQLDRSPPLFLPYLCGERAPIYDENARGVFFGLRSDTDKTAMAYAVLEGVVFSLYHIAEGLPQTQFEKLITSGGSARNPLMLRLKAALFDCPVYGVEENDASALGAAMLAMVGSGAYHTLQEAIAHTVRHEKLAVPDKALREHLLARYHLFRRLYSHLKEDFSLFSNLEAKEFNV